MGSRLVYGVQASVSCTGWCMVVWGLGWGMVYRLVYGRLVYGRLVYGRLVYGRLVYGV